MLNGFRPLSATLPLESQVSPGAFGGEDATAYLGTNNVLAGLVHTQPPDGLTLGTFVGGHNCRANGPDPTTQFYFYFNLDDAVCFENTTGQAATVEIEFYDNSPGTRFRLQYDGLGGAYVDHPDIVDPPDLGGWKNIRWNITDGFFGNRQNNGSDFRIALFPGEVASIRRVSLFLPEEQGGQVGDEAPRITLLNGSLRWPATVDAVGWRLVSAENLTGGSWQEVAGPFGYTNGLVVYEVPAAHSGGFYKLQRRARR
jgi:hypothetical protein